MPVRTPLLGAALAAGLAMSSLAMPHLALAAPVLTSSFASWQAAVGAAHVVTTTSTGLFDPFALVLPVTSTIPLADGRTVRLSTPAQVTQPQDGFPYALPDSSSPDLLIPVDAAGNQVRTETFSTAGLDAFGLSVVPFSSSQAGPFTIILTLAGGGTLTATLPGGSFGTGTTAPAFLGYYGGPVSSLALATSDPNGFAFGRFTTVPEPASLLLLAGMVGALGLARRRA